MKVICKYLKPFDFVYNIYYGGIKIKNNKDYEIPGGAVLTFVERNDFLSKYWWVYVLINILGAIFCAFDDWEKTRTKIKTWEISLGEIKSDTLTVLVKNNSEKIEIQGVDSFTVLSEEEKEMPVIAKRKKIARIILISLPVTILVAIAVALAVTLI